ncbi:MAG: hypothetical protein VX152_12235, partial [Pseudomonadota bacterium]|nr:hypothetical protein [Pseudomonadota bacterium]
GRVWSAGRLVDRRPVDIMLGDMRPQPYPAELVKRQHAMHQAQAAKQALPKKPAFTAFAGAGQTLGGSSGASSGEAAGAAASSAAGGASGASGSTTMRTRQSGCARRCGRRTTLTVTVTLMATPAQGCA